MPESRLTLAREVDGGRHVVRLYGELDLISAPELEREMDSICGQGAARVLLDLENIKFIDSTGLRAILAARQLCAGSGCELTLTRGSMSVQRLFKLTGLVDQLSFSESENSAAAQSAPSLED